MVPAHEPLRDPFHVRYKLSSTESDDLDGLRDSSERAVFTRRLQGGPSAPSLTSPPVAVTSGYYLRRRRSPPMKFLTNLITRRADQDNACTPISPVRAFHGH